MNMLRAFRAFGAAFALVTLGFFAHAVTGTPPSPGPNLIDGTWLNGVVGGQNFSYQSGVTAKASGTQTTCTQLTPGIYLYQVDTVASTNDSVCIPFAIAGTNMSIRNNGAQTLGIFAQIGTNIATATTDQINNTTNTSVYTLTAQNVAECFSAKNGSWSCARGN